MKKDNKTIVNKIIPDFNPSNQNFSGAGSAYPHNVLINGKEIKPWPFNNKVSGDTPTTINWDTTPTAEHGEGYAVTSEGIKTYVDTKETNLQSQINDKQNITDNNLQTTDKTIIGAINEVNGKTNDLVITRYFSSNYFTLGPKGSYTVQINFTVPTGYKFLAVSNIASSGFNMPMTSSAGELHPTNWLSVDVLNTSSSEPIYGYITASILFIKE